MAAKILPNGQYEDREGKRYILNGLDVEYKGDLYKVLFTDASTYDDGPRIVFESRKLGNKKLHVARRLRPIKVLDTKGEVRRKNQKRLEDKAQEE